MVSFHDKLLSSTRKKANIAEWENSLTKKRKWPEDGEVEEVLEKRPVAKTTKSIFDAQAHTQQPHLDLDHSPLEDCQGCLHKKYMYSDYNREVERISPEEPQPPSHDMSLDLELYLPCGSSSTRTIKSTSTQQQQQKANDDQRGEMVTAVCYKCHMLVMMYKSSPACPNCKFMHPPDQIITPPALFKQQGRLTLSLSPNPLC